jgi:ketosteroid isomerase-like protein
MNVVTRLRALAARGAIGVAALAAAAALAACAISIGDRSYDDDDSDEAARRAILRVLDDQANAWNEGDLEGFMEGYWESPELVFTSGGRVQRGWQTTLDRYRATYGTNTSTMGRLSFYDVEIHPAGDSAWVLGRWALDRSGDDLGGVFTLVFRRFGDRWLIVHDHTSSDPVE